MAGSSRISWLGKWIKHDSFLGRLAQTEASCGEAYIKGHGKDGQIRVDTTSKDSFGGYSAKRLLHEFEINLKDIT